ncbi:DMT family transporter [Desulfogranum marinum]|uniref:DMT family transporter n=1 Tax=Desulfogranum marinum TaxID=453220 RepID=UPI001964F47C|nr:DMT family transporter [Desulfogranum marinum]MBM9513642.1 DMT family transporter [Desulfogranum marinum]
MPYLLLILTTLFWSGNFVLSRGMHASIPPLGLSFWRWSVALLILCFFGVHHLWRERTIAQDHSRFIVIQGLLGVTGFNSLIYLAMQSTTAINAVLVNSCVPILIALASWLMYRDLLTPRQILGVCVSLCGVLLIIAKGQLATLLQVDFNRGDIYVLIAAVMWAFYSANLKRYPPDLHPFAYLCAIVIVGLIGIFPFYLLELFQGQYIPLTTSSIVTIIYVALFASVLAFIFWNRAVRTIGANKAGPFVHLMPVFSTILAVLFLGEKLTAFHLQGMLLIFSGIVLTTFRIRQKA